MKAIVVALEAVMLTLAVGVFVRSEGHVSFPSSVPVAQVQPQRAPVSVSVNHPLVGTTSTAVLSVRGGQAATAGIAANSGQVGYRRLDATRTGR
jgi:hypothetical protein